MSQYNKDAYLYLLNKINTDQEIDQEIDQKIDQIIDFSDNLFKEMIVNDQTVSPNQSGGGAWSSYSYDNDSTYDLISFLKITKYNEEKDENEYNRSITQTNSALKRMFAEYRQQQIKTIKKTQENIKCMTDDKNVDYCWTHSTYWYLGVIIFMLINEYQVGSQYCVRALIHAYKEYLTVCMLQEGSGWKKWEDRKKSLIDEIHLINLAINTAKKNICMIKSPLNMRSKREKIKLILSENKKELTMDKVFMKRRTIQSKYYWFSPNILPPIDPKLLRIGTVMMGLQKRKKPEIIQEIPFIVADKHVWKPYDPFENTALLKIDEKLFIDLYGDMYTNLMSFR